jgi:hypothetical protein
MPYYPEALILFIHIPKTGGTSLHNYFVKKYNITINKYKNAIGLYYLKGSKSLSLQHMILSELICCKFINIDKNVKIITIVRNPYTRLISELFYNKHINKNTNKDDVYKKIFTIFEEYEKDNYIYDNHIRPQYQFINDKVIILHQENLITDLNTFLKIDDFNSKYNNNYIITDYFNENSLKLINKFYEKDFIIFNYNFEIILKPFNKKYLKFLI